MIALSLTLVPQGFFLHGRFPCTTTLPGSAGKNGLVIAFAEKDRGTTWTLADGLDNPLWQRICTPQILNCSSNRNVTAWETGGIFVPIGGSAVVCVKYKCDGHHPGLDQKVSTSEPCSSAADSFPRDTSN